MEIKSILFYNCNEENLYKELAQKTLTSLSTRSRLLCLLSGYLYVYRQSVLCALNYRRLLQLKWFSDWWVFVKLKTLSRPSRRVNVRKNHQTTTKLNFFWCILEHYFRPTTPFWPREMGHFPRWRTRLLPGSYNSYISIGKYSIWTGGGLRCRAQ